VSVNRDNTEVIRANENQSIENRVQGRKTLVKAAVIAAGVLISLSGISLLLLGTLFWLGRTLTLLNLHIALGIVLVLCLWLVAGLALASGPDAGASSGDARGHDEHANGRCLRAYVSNPGSLLRRNPDGSLFNGTTETDDGQKRDLPLV
jgi:hypothetical protein